MARLKTKSDPIHVRLPIDLDDTIRRWAAAKGLTAGAWLEQLVMKYVAEQAEKRRDQKAAQPVPGGRCAHAETEEIPNATAGKLIRCKNRACGATRTRNGEWTT